jgi:hypothetical protein
MWYIWVGLVWAIWTLRFNNKQRHAVREHWFPVLLFSTFLWPFFMYFAYEKGMAPQLVQNGVIWVKNKAFRIYG